MCPECPSHQEAVKIEAEVIETRAIATRVAQGVLAAVAVVVAAEEEGPAEVAAVRRVRPLLW